AKPKLADATIPELLEQLKSPEGWTRHFAKRVLADRNPKEVAAALATWTKTLTDDHDRVEALWTAQTVGLVDPAFLKELLRAKDANARVAATRAVGRLKPADAL